MATSPQDVSNNPYYNHLNSYENKAAESFRSSEPTSTRKRVSEANISPTDEPAVYNGTSPEIQLSPKGRFSRKTKSAQTPRSASIAVPPFQYATGQPTLRTHSLAGPHSTAVFFERDYQNTMDLSPPNDDEIIIVTVRITNSFRRASVEGGEDLPSRPRPRNFLRRFSTRLSSPADECKYTAIKMPRRDYKRLFVRDKDGNYVGSEPEREWSREDLEREYGEYQHLPLTTLPNAQFFGEWGAVPLTVVGESLGPGVGL